MNTYSRHATETNLGIWDTEECEESSVAEYEHQYSTTPTYKTSYAGKIAEIIGHTPELTALVELRYWPKDGYKETKVPQDARNDHISY